MKWRLKTVAVLVRDKVTRDRVVAGLGELVVTFSGTPSSLLPASV